MGRMPRLSQIIQPEAGPIPAPADWQTEQPVAILKNLLRLTAPNPGVMTGPGTNTYVVRSPGAGTDVAIVDAGPADTRHLQALTDAVGKRTLRALVVTHTHIDHSPAVAALHERSGALRAGYQLEAVSGTPHGT